MNCIRFRSLRFVAILGITASCASLELPSGSSMLLEHYTKVSRQTWDGESFEEGPWRPMPEGESASHVQIVGERLYWAGRDQALLAAESSTGSWWTVTNLTRSLPWALSPNGSQVASLARWRHLDTTDLPPDTFPWCADLILTELWSGEERTLSECVRDPLLVRMTWGPGPNHLTYVDQAQRILIVDLDDDPASLRVLTHGTYPAWSPDGRTLAFVRDGSFWVHDNPIGKEDRIYTWRRTVGGFHWTADSRFLCLELHPYVGDFLFVGFPRIYDRDTGHTHRMPGARECGPWVPSTFEIPSTWTEVGAPQ